MSQPDPMATTTADSCCNCVRDGLIAALTDMDDPSRVVARVEGRDYTAAEMIAAIEAGAPAGTAFVRDCARAAARMFVRRRQKIAL